MIQNIRQYLIEELQSSSSLGAFDAVEALLVMYDSGVVSAANTDENGDPLFMINDHATTQQKDWADRLYAHIHNAPNDVWNHYIYGGLC